MNTFIRASLFDKTSAKRKQYQSSDGIRATSVVWEFDSAIYVMFAKCYSDISIRI